jgi:hypothetical protein
MRTLAMRIVTDAALAAGMPAGRITDVSAKDNLTLPRPRMEVDFLPDTLTRTGRKLAVTRAETVQATKKELYEVRFDMTAHAYVNDAAWLEAFEYDFVAAFPRGVNDQRGNWVQIRVNKATFKKEPTKRVGSSEITVFKKFDTLFLITLTGRVTREEEQALLTTFEIVPVIGARE